MNPTDALTRAPAGDAPLTNAMWQVRKDAAIARGEGCLAPIYVDRARGSEIWDVEGNRYIDFATGIAVCNTGHMHPRVHEAVVRQIDRFSHSCIMVTPYDSAVELAERLNRLAPGSTPKKTMFVTTGAEAIENCVKIARAHTGRRGVIAFDGGYHGRTLLTLGLTGKVAPYKLGFGPFPGDLYRIPYPIAYHGVSVQDTLNALAMLFKTDLAPSDCAAILIEPVQGEGGFYPAPVAFLQALRRICDEHGIVLVHDEVQSGFGRTGRFFATEYAGVEPDLMSVAKGIAGGFPLAGVIGKAEIMDAPGPGGLGGTYAGSPVGCAAGLAVLDVMEEEKLVEASQRIGARFDARLRAFQALYPTLIGDVRTERGAMIAVELVQDGNPAHPNPELTKKIAAAAPGKGLILLTCGIRGNVFRFLPALTISDALIDEGLDIFERCFAEAL